MQKRKITISGFTLIRTLLRKNLQSNDKRTLLRKNLVNVQQGFTLIELLIVIAVIGGLAAIFLANYPGTQKKARDAIRRNDLRQYQTALELYGNRNNSFYPSRPGNVQADTVLCSDVDLTDCLADPKDGQTVCTAGLCRYFFRSDGSCSAGGACAVNYFLYTRLEQPQDASLPYYFVCSNGEAGEVATIPAAGVVTCPVP